MTAAFSPPPTPPCPPPPDFFIDLWLTEGRAVVLSRLLVALGFPVCGLGGLQWQGPVPLREAAALHV